MILKCHQLVEIFLNETPFRFPKESIDQNQDSNRYGAGRMNMDENRGSGMTGGGDHVAYLPLVDREGKRWVVKKDFFNWVVIPNIIYILIHFLVSISGFQCTL